MKIIAGFVVICLAIVGCVGLYLGGFALSKDASTRSQNIDTAVFHNTQGYVDGKTQTIEKLRREYEAAPASDRPILRTQIQREAATVDKNLLPSDTRSFVESLR